MQHDLRQSLNDLEPVPRNQRVNTPPTELVARCTALRSKPLKDYTIEDLRLSLGQSIGLTWLVPLALAQLQQDLFTEGDYYPGDLLSSVSRLPDSYWQGYPTNLKSFVQLLRTQLPASVPVGMPSSAFREVRRRLDSLTALLA